MSAWWHEGHPRGRWQDGGAEPRPQERPGCPAFGHRLDQRIRLVAGLGRLRRKVQRDQGDPQVLKLVDIKGAIITIDAMGAQKAIAAQVIAGEGDYVLA